VGLSVHSSGRQGETTLKSMLKRQLARKVFPVHRLDHRTSGAILFAFDSHTCGDLHQRLVRGQKDYVALLRGEWKFESSQVTMDEPLKVDGVVKDAETEFQLLGSSRYLDMPCSLVLCRPKTGRTHQIRRHAHRLGHPIIGDSQHGDNKVNRLWRNQRGLNRLALHSFSIHLEHDEQALVAPLPFELRNLLEHDEALWNTVVEKDSRLALDFADERGGTFGRNYRSRSPSSTDEGGEALVETNHYLLNGA
jgi:tRNA pseudouridine65 synthase